MYLLVFIYRYLYIYFYVSIYLFIYFIYLFIFYFFFSEIARDFLHRTTNYNVVAGLMSPVHDKYGKEVR